MQFNTSPTFKAVTRALALTSCLGVTSAAIAQEQDNNEEESLVEKITVTAQKRVEKLSEVPVAVSVLRSDQIDSAFANNIEGLQNLVPSVSFNKGTTNRNSSLTVRGIGTISFSVAAEPSVSTVVDGVVLGRSGQAFIDLYDLERIEVLRGPQGTLFGKNASAGVVNITTKRPTFDTTGSVELSLFQDNEYKFRGTVSGGLTDNVAASLAVVKSQFDGYIDNVFNNQTTQGYDKEGIRAMFDIEVNATTDVLVIAENVQSDDNCCADLELRPHNRNLSSAALPAGGGLDLDQRSVEHDFETRTLDETTSFSIQIDTEIGNHQFTSITAWRSWDNTEFREGDFTSTGGDSVLFADLNDVDAAVALAAVAAADASESDPDTSRADAINAVLAGTKGVTFTPDNPPFQLHDVGPQEWDQVSQEFRIASPLGQPLEYQVGFFYWNQKSERNFTREASCQIRGGGNVLNLDILIDNPELTCNTDDIISATAFMETEFDNWAVFADSKYHLNDDLRLLFGIRYTDDEVSFKHNRRANDPYGRIGVGVRNFDTDFEGATDKTNTSIKAGVQYDITDDSMTYFTYSQGYKGPAFNVFYNMNTTDTLPIDEETSDAYELGYKYAAGNLLFNAAIFRTEIDGFQANNPEQLGEVVITRLTNAGSVITEGIEFDFMWQATENFTLFGGLASVSAEVDEFRCPVTDPECTGSSGADLPVAPDLKYSLSGEYVWELNSMNIILNGSYVYTDEIFSGAPGQTPGQDDPALLPDYALLNASLAFSFEDDAYRISLIGKNLTDESYATAYNGDGFRYQIPRDADRYFGVQFRANF